MLYEYWTRFSSLFFVLTFETRQREYEKKEKTLKVVLQKQFVSGLSFSGYFSSSGSGKLWFSLRKVYLGS